jgi:hypothetical protein
MIILWHIDPLPITDVYTGESTTAVAREQLCGHVYPTREHAIMEQTFSVRSVPGLYNED